MQEMTIGEKADLVFQLYEQKADADKVVKDIASQIEALEYQIRTEMEELGLENIKTDKGSMFLQAELYPKIENWNAFMSFCVMNGFENMIQKRVSGSAFKDYFTQNGEYPDGTDGTTTFKLGRRKAR